MSRLSFAPLAVRLGAPVWFALFAAFLLFAVAIPSVHQAVASEEEKVIEISIKDHKFDPAEVKLPKDTAVKISVKNLDPSVEEFESGDLGFEKVIAGNSSAVIRLKPLQPGTYLFYGEYHTETALGHITVE